MLNEVTTVITDSKKVDKSSESNGWTDTNKGRLPRLDTTLLHYVGSVTGK